MVNSKLFALYAFQSVLVLGIRYMELTLNLKKTAEFTKNAEETHNPESRTLVTLSTLAHFSHSKF